MEKIFKPETLCTAKEVMKIIDVSDSKASRMITQLRDALGKPKPQVITITEFKEYFGLS